MSACISSKGEYSSHTITEGNFICDDCGVLDEDGLFAERDTLRAERDRARSLAATLEAQLVEAEALASAVVHAWDNAAPVEPCDACRGHGFVELWTFEDEKRMDEAVDEIRAALKGDA